MKEIFGLTSARKDMKITNIIFIVFLFSIVTISNVLADDTAELIVAAGFGELNEVVTLLSIGVDVNTTDHDGFTALMFAARYGHRATVEVLLASGADVDMKSKLFGYTALMSAIVSGKVMVAKVLLDQSADVNARDDDGVTALTFAEELNDAVIIKLLKRHGATK